MNNGFPAKTVSLEINPPVDADFEKLKKRIDSIAGFIDFVNVTSCPMGKLRPSAVASAYFIQNRCGVKTVANITCRDSNLLGLASELLGADLLGIKNILAVTGDPAQEPSDSVFQSDVFELIKLAADMNRGETFAGKIARKTSFKIGCATLVPPSSPEGIYRRLMRKRDAGASFCITQPVYSVDSLEKFLKITESVKMDKIIGFMPFASLRMARYIDKNVPGINIPHNLMRQLEQDRENVHKIGIVHIKKIISEAKKKGLLEGISGVHFMLYGNDTELLSWAKNFLKD